MSTHLTVIPAYGRDYKTAKAMREDWDADKDFSDTFTGRKINKSQALSMGLKITGRFCQNTKITTLVK